MSLHRTLYDYYRGEWARNDLFVSMVLDIVGSEHETDKEKVDNIVNLLVAHFTRQTPGAIFRAPRLAADIQRGQQDETQGKASGLSGIAERLTELAEHPSQFSQSLEPLSETTAEAHPTLSPYPELR